MLGFWSLLMQRVRWTHIENPTFRFALDEQSNQSISPILVK